MQSVLDEIRQLRRGLPMVIDRQNANRYRVVVSEQDGTETAYCFSTPIYHRKSGRLIALKLRETANGWCAVGSNAQITVSNVVRMEDDVGVCTLTTAGAPVVMTGTDRCRNGQYIIEPTTNGVAFRCNIQDNQQVSLIAEVSIPFMQTRCHSQYAALMREPFVPFAVVSCIGSFDENGKLIAPAILSCEKLDEMHYAICLTAASPLARWLMFEVNLYERKLFQDTTVESGNPAAGNSYGGMGYIGYTESFGQQWLYTKPDFPMLSDLLDRRIYQAILHIPALNGATAPMHACGVAARFCSLGSNWKNKVAGNGAILRVAGEESYWSIDLKKLLSDPVTGILTATEGVILKPAGRKKDFNVIATADSYYAPQILEIRYR